LTIERLVQRLQGFGITRDEAKIYVFLLRTGPCPARIVTKKFEINRMKTYRTLKDLEEKGMVHRIMGRPVRFSAAPVRETLERYVDEIRGKLSDLEEGEREILDGWEMISRGIEPSLEEPRFRIYQGRQQNYDLISQMCGRAVGEISILTTVNDMTRLSLLGMDDKLKTLARGGTNVRILTQVDKDSVVVVENYLDRIDVRNVSLPAPTRLVIVDEDETLTTVALNDSMSITTQEDTGLWTNASSYVKAMKIFFDALWRMAPDAGAVIESIKTGSEPQELRIITTRGDFVETFLSMIERSEKSVDMFVERLKDLPISTRFLRDHFNKDIRIRMLTRVDRDSLHDIKAVSDSVTVRHRSASSGLMLTMIDGSEVILHLPGWRAMEYAVWSNLKAYVDTMGQVFEDYWRDGSPAQEIVSKLASQEERFVTLGIIGEALDRAGWSVETPGELVGKSGTTHSFSLTANKPGFPGGSLALELLPEGEAFGTLIEHSVRSVDLKSAMLILASTEPPRREEIELAELYGIKLINAPEAELLAVKVCGATERIEKG